MDPLQSDVNRYVRTYQQSVRPETVRRAIGRRELARPAGVRAAELALAATEWRAAAPPISQAPTGRPRESDRQVVTGPAHNHDQSRQLKGSSGGA